MIVLLCLFLYSVIGVVLGNMIYSSFNSGFDAEVPSVLGGIFWPVTLIIWFGNGLYRSLFKRRWRLPTFRWGQGATAEERLKQQIAQAKENLRLLDLQKELETLEHRYIKKLEEGVDPAEEIARMKAEAKGETRKMLNQLFEDPEVKAELRRLEDARKYLPGGRLVPQGTLPDFY